MGEITKKALLVCVNKGKWANMEGWNIGRFRRRTRRITVESESMSCSVDRCRQEVHRWCGDLERGFEIEAMSSWLSKMAPPDGIVGVIDKRFCRVRCTDPNY